MVGINNISNTPPPQTHLLNRGGADGIRWYDLFCHAYHSSCGDPSTLKKVLNFYYFQSN
jgi:hypothetical protein